MSEQTGHGGAFSRRGFLAATGAAVALLTACVARP
ncbi:twin-arginine translocation signal domain-containing protein [Streptomyces sp. WAC07094]|nr:twin-arginine translocation signal domain-containing protein [Streptomyces sp. WAC07094]